MSTTFSATTFANSGLNGPYGLAFDKNGNLFSATREGTGRIVKITPSGTVSTFVNSGLNNPSGLAFKNGNLFCANESADTILKITPSGSVSILADSSDGLDGPAGLAFDKYGNLYCTNWNNNTIVKITPSGSASTFYSGLNRPTGLAFDKNGNLFCCNSIANTIVKITPSGTVSTFATGITNPRTLAFDKNGNLYTSIFNDKLFRISSTGVVQELTITGAALDRSLGVAFDHKGNLFVSNYDDNNIIRVALGVPSEILGFPKEEEEVVIVDILEELKVFLESLSQKDINNDTLQSLILKYQNSREALLLLEKKFGVSIVS
jgi:DNA-binding beta-propeller fold protein YncE